MSRRPHIRLVGLLLLVGLVVSACAKRDGDSEEVRDIVDETITEPHRFVYTETNPDGTTTIVQGLIEDDFRYKARLLVDGQPILDRVVSDDTAAVRFLEPKFLTRFIDKDAAPLVDSETSIDGVDVYSALQSKRWVVDVGGAPPQLVSVDDVTDPGIDPIFDALNRLATVRVFSLQVFTPFVLYNEESLSPTYRTDEDPFPAPEDGSGVTRYDVFQPEIPNAADTVQNFLIGDENFRKMAIYVKDGKIIRVSEDVGVSERLLKDFRDYMTQLVDISAPEDVRAGFRSTVDGLQGQELADFLLSSLNTFRELRGDPPARFRSSTYELLDVGADDIVVDLPVDDTIDGNLAVLVNLGVKPIVPDDEEEDAADAAGDGVELEPAAAGDTSGTESAGA